MKLPFSFKIGLAISLLAVGATSGSLVFFYSQSKSMLLFQMGNRLKDIGRTSIYLFGPEERKAIVKLKEEVNQKSLPVDLVIDDIQPGDYRRSLPEDAASKIMQSNEFQSLVSILQKIKNGTRKKAPVPGDEFHSEGDLPTLAYATIITTLPSTSDRKVIRFIADADYADPEFPNPVGNLFYNNSEAIREAFDGSVVADKDFRYENTESLLSAGIPIISEKGEILAILSLDYNAKGEVNLVNRLKHLCIAIVIASFILSLVVAAILANILNRPIRKLREGADRVKEKDFTARIDLDTNDELGLLANAFNAMVAEICAYSSGLEAYNAAYARFVPKEFLQHLGHKSILDIKLGDQVQRQMTILFADIRSFTTISESMSPRDNFDFINDYLKTVSPVIRKHKGFVDKYIGDAVMALFPESPENALEAAIEMMQVLDVFNKEGAELGRPPIHIGIGMHTGNLMLGTIGESMRMEGTVIADAVNLSSRLEGLTKEFGSDIIISEKVFKAVSGKTNFQIRALGPVHVKGKKTGINIFEVLNSVEDDITRKKIISKVDFEKGVEALQNNQPVRAKRYFRKVLKLNNKDTAARLLLSRCVAPSENDIQKTTRLIELEGDLDPQKVAKKLSRKIRMKKRHKVSKPATGTSGQEYTFNTKHRPGTD